MSTRDVFVSHSSKDKIVADAICATLEAQHIRCWIAPRDIVPGTPWGEAIVDAISASRVMVLIFSDNSNRSPQILREVERAVNKGIVIVPFRIQQVQPTKSLEYFISTTQWLDALTPPIEHHIATLVNSVKAFLSLQTDASKAGHLAATHGQEASGTTGEMPSTHSAVRAASRTELPQVADAPARAVKLQLPIGLAQRLQQHDQQEMGIEGAQPRSNEVRKYSFASVPKSIAFSPDGKRILVSLQGYRSPLWLIDLNSLDRPKQHVHNNHEIVAVSFVNNRRAILGCGGFAGNDGQRLETFDIDREPPLQRWSAGILTLRQLAAMSVGLGEDKQIYIGQTDGVIGRGIAKTSSKSEFTPFGNHREAVTSLALSQDGSLLVSGGFDASVRIWDPKAQSQIGIIETSDVVRSVALSNDGSLIAGGIADGSVRVWDLRTLAETAMLGRHAAPVQCVAFPPESRVLLSGGYDGQLLRHDLINGGPSSPLASFAVGITSMAIAPEGRQAMVGLLDKTARLLDLTAEKWLAACADDVPVRPHSSNGASRTHATSGRTGPRATTR